MYLKNYQRKVIKDINEYLIIANELKAKFSDAMALLPEEMRDSLNFVKNTHDKLNLSYTDICKNGLNQFYPRINIKVPTGGGKTVIAVEAIKEYQTIFAQKKTGLVVWIVPKEIIYKQTIDRLRDKSHPYRQLLDQTSGGKTIIAEKGQKLTKQDIEENLVILFIMAQSISRSDTSDALKVFKDSGGFDNFFPADNRYDLHYEWLQRVPNLDCFTEFNIEGQAQLITSLGNVIRVSKPFIIIDEYHKVFTPLAKKTIDGLNPEMVLGLSATPKEGMNNLCVVSGLELKDEEMVKLDLHIIPPVGQIDNDWKAMLQNIIQKRDNLEVKSIEFRRETGQYIRPIALIQCERTGKDQRGKDFVHSEDVKEHLINEGINPSEIAIKSSSKNDIENVDLFSQDCPVRYIITKEALNEGWDCSFAYVLGIIPNVNSNTGVTQLVGRILRQPRAKKTGIKDLDESYIYYSRGDTAELLNKIIKGFEEEGLGDLVSSVQIANKPEVNAKKNVNIKEKYKKYEYAFYLPVWVTVLKGDNNFRTFKYELDIKPNLNFENLSLTKDYISKIKNSLSEERSERNTFSVTIDKSNEIISANDYVEINNYSSISLSYITRRFGEFIDNAFLSRKKALEWIDMCKVELGIETTNNYFSFITAQLTKYIEEYKLKREEEIFISAIENNLIKLAVSDHKKIGFKVPENDIIITNNLPNLYNLNLYNDIELATLNSLEKKVVQILEKQETTLFWFRNRAAKNWYSIQGWRENKIRPDFVVAKKKGDDELELIYLLESKGEHLLGNDDTAYKNNIFRIMTEQKKSGKIVNHQTNINFDLLNEEIETYLIEGSNEEIQIRELMK